MVAQWHHMMTEIWVNIGSGNGLLPDGTKPLPEPMLDLSSVRCHGIHLRALSLDDVKIPINKTRLKTAVLKWHPGLPGANELINTPLGLQHDTKFGGIYISTQESDRFAELISACSCQNRLSHSPNPVADCPV